jgi:hypothetical protein
MPPALTQKYSIVWLETQEKLYTSPCFLFSCTAGRLRHARKNSYLHKNTEIGYTIPNELQGEVGRGTKLCVNEHAFILYV